jgi:beta-N-acetylhexosaminidase
MSEAALASVGLHFMLGLRPGAKLDARDQLLLRDLRPAGVILYKSNFRHDCPYDQWLASHRELIASIRDAVARQRLFIAVDHEGGRVCRTPPPITRFSYARDWQDRSGAVGAAMGTEFASLGVNLNFAPVLDIDSNPGNPVIGPRAFGSTAGTVVERALSFVREMENCGVRGCGKHFPGHGDTLVDSHYELPTVEATIGELRGRELQPFAAAIRAGIGMIMTSHILFRRLDDSVPATLSRRIVSDLLRREMGFQGVIVSDDIGMRSAHSLFGNPDSAVKFMAAGNDMLMICAHWGDTELARPLAQSIIEARDSGALESSFLEHSQERIETMLTMTAQPAVEALSEQVFLRHGLVGPQFSERTVEVT